MAVAKRKPWLAALLSLLTPGLGHMYAGGVKKGVFIFALFPLSIVVFAAVAMSPLFHAPFNIIFGLFVLFASLVFLIFVILDAIRLARRQAESYQLKAYNKWYIYAVIVVIAAFIFDLREDYLIQAYKIPAASMLPTLLVGDRIFVDKISYQFTNPARGDVVVFKFPDDETKVFIKRVIGLPGETVEIRDKQVLINGQNLTEEYVIHADPNVMPCQAQPRDNFGPVQVAQKTYFVLGDNRDQSLDSQFFGPIDRSKVLGRGRTIYLSWSPRGGIGHWERIGQTIK